MGAIAGAIIQGVGSTIQGAGTIIGGILQYYAGEETAEATREADARNFFLANQERRDVLAQNQISNQLARDQFNLAKDTQRFNKASANEKMRREDVAALGGTLDRLASTNMSFKNWLIQMKKV